MSGNEPKGRIPMLERDQVPPEIGALYNALLQQRGVVPNMFKVVANVPAVAVGFAAFLKPLLSDGALPAGIKSWWPRACRCCWAPIMR